MRQDEAGRCCQMEPHLILTRHLAERPLKGLRVGHGLPVTRPRLRQVALCNAVPILHRRLDLFRQGTRVASSHRTCLSPDTELVMFTAT